MLKIGDKAPDFQAEASTGGTLSNADLLGQPYVLFFYPKSFTSGCTLETRRFAEKTPEFEALNTRIVGISNDSLKTQCKFADKMGAEFPILADKKGKIMRAFEVKRGLLPLAKRVTFVIDEEGVIESVYASEVHAERHVDEVMTHLKNR